MRKICFGIFSLFIFCLIVHREVIEYSYSDWSEEYPSDIEEIRIESQDRYRWYKIENDERIETEEYYDSLEGYEKIEESKKTFYRYINEGFIMLNSKGELVKDTDECRKEVCLSISINNNPPAEEPPNEEPPEEIDNPNTFDPLYIYYCTFLIGFVLLVILNMVKIYLVLSNRWK